MRLGTLGGTSIGVEPTFIILSIFFVVLDLEERVPMSIAVLWIPVLLISVLIHELGHAALNSLLGFGPSAIILGGLGGRTLSRRDGKPWQDTLVSLAGPLASLVLAVVFFVLSRNLATDTQTLSTFFELMFRANLYWGIFNLIPVYPLDGGHVVRSLAAQFTTAWRAFSISVWSSLVFGAIVIGVAILLHRPIVAIVAGMMVVQNFQSWTAARSAVATYRRENVS